MTYIHPLAHWLRQNNIEAARQRTGTYGGFDALRVFLACAILLWHCYRVTHRHEGLFSFPETRALGLMLVPMFFCLSGFLVAGSALRVRSLNTFLTFRALRIFPALLVEVCLSAVVLGGLVTVLPLDKYYTHPRFFSYFSNIIGHVQFTLPGVFKYNPDNIVNLNLWTLPPEFYCYGVISFVLLLGILYRPPLLMAAFIASMGILIAMNPSSTQAPVPFSILVYSFGLGTMAYVFGRYIPLHPVLFLASTLLAYILFYYQYSVILATFFTAYMTLYIGTMTVPPLLFFRRGDYSYGIYLYGYPISQSVWYYLPWAHSWQTMYAAALPITCLFAAFSWHCIERPCLSLKRYCHRRPIVDNIETIEK